MHTCLEFYIQKFVHYVPRLTAFVAGTDVLITDATHTDADVKTLYLFHHDPNQDDDAINAKHAAAEEILTGLGSQTQLVSPHETQTVKI